MGKQLSIYLNEVESKRLTEIAIRECRRPHDQARYFLLNALDLTLGEKEEEAEKRTTSSDVQLNANSDVNIRQDSHVAVAS